MSLVFGRRSTLAVLTALLLAGAAVLAAEPADSIVAAVGDELILASELSRAVNFLRLSQPDTTLSDSALELLMVDLKLLQSQL